MLIESFSQAILKWLRVPPGAFLRHNTGKNTNSYVDIAQNDYIQAIVDITVDDICIGDSPLTIDYKLGNDHEESLQKIQDEFNTIVKDVARDLCIQGISVWESSFIDGNFLLTPCIEPVEVYMNNKKELVVLQDDKKLECILFINYNKQSLSVSENDKYKFLVTPTPMQLKGAQKTIEGIANAERSIARYRTLLRPLRYVNVDIGVAQGKSQQDVADTISSAINSNSESLNNNDSFTDFDDNIPIIPNRKGLGRADIVTDVPSADIKELADLDYFLNKLNLMMRFPATYTDFTTNLNASAVSTIRGDIRYNKLCLSVQSKITETITKFLKNSLFGSCEPICSLIKLPTTEDDDVIAALSDHTDLASTVEEFVMDAESKELAKHRLSMLKDLFDSTTTSPMLQKWFDNFEKYIETSTHWDEELQSSSNSRSSDILDEPEFSETEFPNESEEPEEISEEPSDGLENSEDAEYLDTYEV